MPKIKITVDGIEEEVEIEEDDDVSSDNIKTSIKKGIKKNIKKTFDYRSRIVSATPLICLAIYLTIGMLGGGWGYSALIFLLIPIVPTLLYGFGKGKNILMTIITVLVFIAFVVIGVLGHWDKSWLVFFIIPIASILLPKKKDKE